MSRKAKTSDGLQPGKPHPALDKILTWQAENNPLPEELTDWLTHQQDQLEPYIQDIYAKKSLIFQAEALKSDGKINTTDYVHLERWRETLPLILNYLDVIDGAAEVLEDTNVGRVSNAFTQGVRLGILHEKLLSLVDGRYMAHWVKQEGGRNAAEATNEVKAKKRPDYLSAVKSLMENHEYKYHPACDQVAIDLDVSKKTVENHTKALAPRRNRKNA